LTYDPKIGVHWTAPHRECSSWRYGSNFSIIYRHNRLTLKINEFPAVHHELFLQTEGSFEIAQTAFNIDNDVIVSYLPSTVAIFRSKKRAR